MDYNIENTLCCGAGGMLSLTNEKLARQHMERRAKEAKTECIITYCQECVQSMRGVGREAYHILDLIYLEEAGLKEKKQSQLGKWYNRFKSKGLGR